MYLRIPRRIRIFFLIAFSVLLAGCSTDDHLLVVQGKVSYDGKPVESGEITLTPVDGRTSSASAIIRAGQYRIEVPPGKKDVKITGLKIVGSRPAYEGDPNSPTIDMTEQYIPPQYNEKTTLQSDITKAETIDFDLTAAAAGS